MLVLFHGLVGGGCAGGIFSEASPDDDASTSQAVVDNTEWELAPLGAGPWPLPSEDRIYCEEDGYGYEKPVFEVLTDLCDGRVFRQELQIDMKREDYLHVVFWHSALVFDEPATAEVGIAVGDDILWEIQISIPAEETAFRPYILLNADHAKGDDLLLRVLNHGSNSWTFLDFSTGSEKAYPQMDAD
jgi:hypothetical protein